MKHWNQAPLIREQVVLFSPTLDAAISEDHSVRLVDEVLRQMDWSAWESRYVLPAGHLRFSQGQLLFL
jgi:transposase